MLCVYVRVRACVSVFERDETLEYSTVQVQEYTYTVQQINSSLCILFPPL